MPISHAEWQILRACLRGKNVKGRALRVNMSRRTKDGTFLTEMVRNGLLEVVRAEPPDPKPKYPEDEAKRVAFASTYRLAPAGKYAAEYGEANYDMKTKTYSVPAAAIENSKPTTREKVG